VSIPLIVNFASVFLLALSIACKQKATPPPQALPTVSIVAPVEREVVEWDEFTGRLESPETVEIRARVNSYLKKVHFKEGKEVKEGAVLSPLTRAPIAPNSNAPKPNMSVPEARRNSQKTMRRALPI
jgi:multidrug efflux pump subunit AcrA (membrane-fusion protein)